jgi:hypothetical protein
MALPGPIKKYPIDMRKYLYILAIVAALASCKKGAGTSNLWILGRWELYSMSGGFRDTIFARGNGNVYQFYGNNTYKKYTASQLSAQGSIRIANLSEENFFVIYFDKDTTGVQLAYQNGMITLGSSAADGPAWTYQRISY